MLKQEHYILQMRRACLSSAQQMLSTIDSDREILVAHKSDSSLVTTLDTESQVTIMKHLGGELPIVAEEDSDSHALLGEVADFYVVDPLDGTSACKRFKGIIGGQVGFGPMLGLASNGRLTACVYFNLPTRTLFSAKSGFGTWAQRFAYQQGVLTEIGTAQRLSPKIDLPLNESAVIFYPGTEGEMAVVERLKQGRAIETAYRFGGFANDCSRLAQGFEQISIQFMAKAWDLPAALLAAEVGLVVLVDPKTSKVELGDWVLKIENPVIIAPSTVMPYLLTQLS